MRVAAIYDIHGNLPALEAVLADVRGARVDRIVVGGDVVPGPMPRQCLAALLALPEPVDFLYGNGERDVLALRRGETPRRVPAEFLDVMRWVAEEIDDSQADAISGWPATVRLELDEHGSSLFCHATPRDDNELFTEQTPAKGLQPLFAELGSSLVVCGHTHMQFDRTVGDVRLINAGSVGMPFGEPGAYWLLLSGEPELRKTTYDVAAAAKTIRACGYPHARAFAEGNVLRPPQREEMISRFEAAALRGA